MTHSRMGLVLALAVLWAPAGAQSIHADGFEESCLIDADGDRLSNCEEANRGLDYHQADTDGDGLSDGDEVLGTLGGLDLPAFGVDPRHKDMLVEIDWDEDERNCGPHSHRPSAEALEGVRIYASIPVWNVDGVPGYNFIADYGQGGIFTGGNAVDFQNGVTTPLDPPFFAVKAANFAANRTGYFRYQVHAHYYQDFSDSSGLANVGGDNSVVTLNCSYGIVSFQRNTIIHELGHNLGLQHGGDDDCNRKIPYNSLMNYTYQFFGLDVDCDIVRDGSENLGYSQGTRNTLVQGQLSEIAGVCSPDHPQHKAIDWSNNGVIDTGPVSYNGPLSDCGQATVTDFDDYAALFLPPSSPPGGGAPTPADDSGACAPTPEPEH
jgi:hypothetical protein